MQGTWRKARNGWVVVDVHGDEYVAENTMALLPIFEAIRQEASLLNGEPGPKPLGLLRLSPDGLSIVKSGEQIAGTLEETWEPLPSDLEGGADFGADPEWPSTLPALTPSPSPDAAGEGGGASPAAEEPVSYVPAAEDGYEFPAVRGPLNGRREIKCPSHGWQTAVVKDGAYRCQFKRQVCQEPGAPKEEAEKRLVPA